MPDLRFREKDLQAPDPNDPVQAGVRQATILMVDDDPVNLKILSGLLHPSYDVLASLSGEHALQIATATPRPDMILLDVLMPGMDGYDVMTRLRDNTTTRDIPVIFVTGLDSTEDEEKGLKLGAVDYITKPYRPSIVLSRLRNHLELKRARDWLSNQNAYLEAEIGRRTRDILHLQDITINALAELTETRDPETGHHIRRTQEYMRILATHLKVNPRFSGFLTDNVIELLAKSAPLHDIGKVGIPDHILLKPGKLTDEEWVIMKTHCVVGTLAIERAVRDTNSSVDFLDIAIQIARFHHERWDGSGYPEGKKWDAIPIPARLMALADVFDALISHRVYKSAMSVEQARNVIVSERGSHFDPDVVDAFLSGFDDFVLVARKYRDAKLALKCNSD